MEARSIRITFSIFAGGAVLILGGCALAPSNTGPQARPAPRTEETEPPLIVKQETPAAAETDALSGRIQEYVDRLNAARGNSATDAPPAGDPTAAAPAPTTSSEPRSAPAPRAEVYTPAVTGLIEPSAGAPGGGQAGAGPYAAATVAPAMDSRTAEPPAAQPPPEPARVVSVVARPAPDATARPVNRPGPAINCGGVSVAGGGTLRDFIERYRAEADDSEFARQLDARLMYVIAGDYEAAREPLTLVAQEQRTLAARYVESFIAIREARLNDSGIPAGAVTEIESLLEALRSNSELRVPVLAVCREVSGFGQYTRIDPPHFFSGEPAEFVSYAEVGDFRSDQQPDGQYLTHFEMRTRVLNRAGDTVVDLQDSSIQDRCRNRRRDCFIPRLVSLPPTLPPGEYVLKVTLVDKLGQKVAETSTPIRLVARKRS